MKYTINLNIAVGPLNESGRKRCFYNDGLMRKKTEWSGLRAPMD